MGALTRIANTSPREDGNCPWCRLSLRAHTSGCPVRIADRALEAAKEAEHV